MRILIADDHTLTRAGLCLLVEGIAGLQVIGEASTGREAVSMAEQLQPNLILMDIGMPDLNGIEATSRILECMPQIKVIVLSAYADETHVLDALKAGASGFLVKSCEVPELAKGIKAVESGKKYLGADIAGHVISCAMGGVFGYKSSLENLTDRQREVLQLIGEGRGTKEMAFSVGVSVKTIETHKSMLMQRLGIKDIAGLVRCAIRCGLVSL